MELKKKLKIADHAFVTMIKGLRKKWKQPVSFYFSEGGMNAVQIKQLVKTTIEALLKVGFIGVGTVCDQYSANTNALKQLVIKNML